jgi:photosystem II stability/assembly factor-like uncharacterized protein
MKKLILSSVVLMGLSALIVNDFCCDSSEKAYTPRTEFNAAQSFRGQAEYLESLRTNVKTGKINPLDKILAMEALDKMPELKSKSNVALDWIDMGPDNVGGRTRAIVVDKDDSRTIYAGSVAGGLWKSTNRGGTWSKVESFGANLNISTMAQLPNGKFIIGTGCSFESSNGAGGSGFPGYGVYISEDNLATFTHAVDQDGDFLRPTKEFTNNGTFVYTNEIVVDGANPDAVWMAYDKGIAHYNTVTKEFTKMTTAGMTGVAQDIDVSSDGQTIVAIMYTGSGFSSYSTPFMSKDGGATWINMRTEGNLTLAPTNNSGRMEVAISKDDKNYIYFSMAGRGGNLFGVFGTEDGGDNWSSLMPGSVSSFDYMTSSASSQGNYDQAIEVVPGQPGVIILGGITVWRAGFDAAAEQIAQNFAPAGSSIYVHSDIHEFTFDPKTGALWIGCDGGIHRSDDYGQTFSLNNRGYNVTTFFDIGFSNDGKVIGGSQDNGTQLIEFKGITEQTAREVTGGDGFDCGYSKTSSKISFATIYNAALFRSLDDNAYEGFYSPVANLAANNSGTFFSTFQFYENDNDAGSKFFVDFENKTGAVIPAGTELTIDSKTYEQQFKYTTDTALVANAKIKIQDPYSSIFAVGMSGVNGVWMTRGAMQFGAIPAWYRILEVNGAVNEIEFGSDGTMYASTGNTLYRVKNLKDAWAYHDTDLDGDSTVKVHQTDVILSNSSNTITSIAADPNNPNRILVTRGNYNGSTHLYLCENALDANPTFTSIQGDLPDFPVYSGRIDAFDPNLIVIGTEMGIFASEDAGATWIEKNDGDMDRVPVYEIHQQTRTYGGDVTNTGFYYIGTHGRGAFRAENFFNSVGDNNSEFDNDFSLSVFPNPTTEVLKVNTGLSGDQKIEIFNTGGQLVKTATVSSNGTVLSVDVNELNTGNYIVRATTVAGVKTAHFIKK